MIQVRAKLTTLSRMKNQPFLCKKFNVRRDISRNKQEMMELIVNITKKDERIRAVYMNGSRTNPNAPKDIFQDYDIVYVVKETASFIENENWINQFGDLLIMQQPDKIDQFNNIDIDFDRSYGYLMLFTDGNRIDLHIETKENKVYPYRVVLSSYKRSILVYTH